MIAVRRAQAILQCAVSDQRQYRSFELGRKCAVHAFILGADGSYQTLPLRAQLQV